MAKITERVAGRQVRVHEIPRDEWTLGALATADAPFQDDQLDDRTLRFVRWVSGWRLEDIGGKPVAILVDGEELQGAGPLQDDSRIVVGRTELLFDGRRDERRWDEDREQQPRPKRRSRKSGDRPKRREQPDDSIVERMVRGDLDEFGRPVERRPAPTPQVEDTGTDPFGRPPQRSKRPRVVTSGGPGVLRRVLGFLFVLAVVIGFRGLPRIFDAFDGDSIQLEDTEPPRTLSPLLREATALENAFEVLESYPQTPRTDWLDLRERVVRLSQRATGDEEVMLVLEELLRRIDSRLTR